MKMRKSSWLTFFVILFFFTIDGGGCAKLPELVEAVVSMTYQLSWEQKRDYLDLTELARLRWIEKWSIERLARHFQIGNTCLKERLRRIRQNPERSGIDPEFLCESFRGKN